MRGIYIGDPIRDLECSIYFNALDRAFASLSISVDNLIDCDMLEANSFDDLDISDSEPCALPCEGAFRASCLRVRSAALDVRFFEELQNLHDGEYDGGMMVVGEDFYAAAELLPDEMRLAGALCVDNDTRFSGDLYMFDVT